MAAKASTTSSNELAARAYDAIIIGAGFSGLYQLHKLRDELGLNARDRAAMGVDRALS